MCTLQQLENIINEMKDKENKINYLENALKNERNKREKEIKEGTEIIAELKKRLERYKVNDKDKEIARLERENLELKREHN